MFLTICTWSGIDVDMDMCLDTRPQIKTGAAFLAPEFEVGQAFSAFNE